MGKEGIEVSLKRQMQDLNEMRMVQMSKYAEKLGVEMASCGWERRSKLSAWSRVRPKRLSDLDENTDLLWLGRWLHRS